GHRDDIADILCAADLMVHPARKENTGAVILESLMCGTPVICSGSCGNAEFVARSGAGSVTPEPFAHSDLVAAVKSALAPRKLAVFRKKARVFGKDTSAFQGRERAVDVIIFELERRAKSS
ncbi:MAG: glycosyltransferase, partial [Fimbriimonadaceae bacterium]|nr:glycosyltransferase [Alphaproteobacteria bacterium]